MQAGGKRGGRDDDTFRKPCLLLLLVVLLCVSVFVFMSLKMKGWKSSHHKKSSSLANKHTFPPILCFFTHFIKTIIIYHLYIYRSTSPPSWPSRRPRARAEPPQAAPATILIVVLLHHHLLVHHLLPLLQCVHTHRHIPPTMRPCCQMKASKSSCLPFPRVNGPPS